MHLSLSLYIYIYIHIYICIYTYYIYIYIYVCIHACIMHYDKMPSTPLTACQDTPASGLGQCTSVSTSSTWEA